jgi:GNAT superfamily N-acetyltransferase
MPATTITQERPDSPDAVFLIHELQAGLNQVNYPDESRHGYSVDKLMHEGVVFFVTRVDGSPAGCGGVQIFDTDYGEIKRMFVRPQYRGLGLGKMMLDCLAEHARERQVGILRLETGIYQKEAVRLYEQYGFERRSPFGEYKDDPLSIYFEKRLA